MQPEILVHRRQSPMRDASLLQRFLWRRYGIVLLSVLTACALTQALQAVSPHRSLSLVFFFAAVAVSAGSGGLYPGVLATLLSALACDYFFLLPLHSLAIARDDVPLLILFLLGSLLMNGLGERLRLGTRAADQRFHDLVQGLDGIAWEVHPKTLRFTFVSQRAEGILGYPVTKWLETPDFRVSILHPEDKAAAIALHRDALTQGGDHACEYRVFAADGREVWLRETVHAVLHANGSPARLTGLCVDITQRKQAVQELSTLYEQVCAGREHLQRLSCQLVQVQEAERRQIARELHDEIGQMLTGLKLNLEMDARLRFETERDDLNRNNLKEALSLINDLIIHVRELSLNLRPAMLDDLGLLSTLLWHFERYSGLTHVKVVFEHSRLERRFSYEVETTAYRIVQEALTNVARHAGVDEVTVRLWATRESLGIQIRDQGRGFSPDSALNGFSTGGLAGMTERVTLLGGHLDIEATGQGTCLTAELPVNSSGKESLESESLESEIEAG